MKEFPPIRPATPSDFPAVATLLHAASLPSSDIAPSLDGFFVATRDAAVVGVIGVERYGEAALVRSVAVSPPLRGSGLGAALVERAIDEARTMGIRDLYLLTNTAEAWAPRFGFSHIGREEVAASVQTSPQFTGGMCTSAAAMHRRLEG